MATLTGENLLNSILDSTGVTLNTVITSTLTAKLQQMIDDGTASNLAVSIAMSGFSTAINDATDAADLADAVEANKALIDDAADQDAVDAIDFPDYDGEAGDDDDDDDDVEEVGTTYTLTDEIDTITGTSKNDTVIGDDNTASLADTLDMGDGMDTVRLYGTATLPSLNSVEAAEFFNLDDQDVNTANSDSLETVLIKNSTIDGDGAGAGGATNITVSLANGEALTLQNVDSLEAGDGIALSTTNAEETVILNDVAGAVGAVDFDLDIGGSTKAITTLTLEGDTNSSDIDLIDAGNDLVTLNLTGDAGIDVENAAITSLKTIDASENTAGVIITVDAAVDVTITGSGQDDTVIMSDNFDGDDTLDGGEGTDVLYVIEEGNISGDLAVTNFEAVAVGSDDTLIGTTGGIDADRTIDMDNIEGIAAVIVNGSNTALHADFTHTLKDIATTATTINFTGDGDDLLQEFDGVNMDWDSSTEIAAVTVNIGNKGTEGKDFVIHDLSLTNVLDVTINAADIGTATGEELTFETALDVSDAESLTIASNSDVVLAGITGSTDLESIDATDADANVTFGAVSMLADDATVELGDGNDTITITSVDGGAGSFTIDLGEGTDILTLAAGAADTDNEITLGAGSDTVVFADGSDYGNITDFTVGAGGDILDFAAASHTQADATVQTGFNDAATLDFSTNTGFVVDNANNANAATLTAAQADDTIAVTNGADGDKALIAVSTDVDAAVNVYIYQVEAATAITFDGIQLIGVLENTILDNLTAANLADFV